MQIILLWPLGAKGFTGGSDGKESACNAGDPGLISGLGRSPGEGNGNPLQYTSMENPMDRRAWQAAVHGVTKSQTRLIDINFHFLIHSTTVKEPPSSPVVRRTRIYYCPETKIMIYRSS